MPYALCIYPMVLQDLVMKVKMNSEKCKTMAMRIAYIKQKEERKEKIDEDLEFDMFWDLVFHFFI